MTEEEKKALNQAAREIYGEIKRDFSDFKTSRRILSVEEQIFQIEEFLSRIHRIDTEDEGIESKCDDLEEQIDGMYGTLPMPSSAEEQLACLTKLRKNHETGEDDEGEKYMKKLARKAREQYPDNEELQAVVNKIIAPAGSSFLKKMWIENRSLSILLLLLLSVPLILFSLFLFGLFAG